MTDAYKHAEGSRMWRHLYARYSHTGCPGAEFQDNCAAPWECAGAGRCQILAAETVEDREHREIMNEIEPSHGQDLP